MQLWRALCNLHNNCRNKQLHTQKPSLLAHIPLSLQLENLNVRARQEIGNLEVEFLDQWVFHVFFIFLLISVYLRFTQK